MDQNKALLDLYQRQRQVPAPIPLLINPADVKKEFDKHRVATPAPFQQHEDEEPSSSREPKRESKTASSENGGDEKSCKKEKEIKKKKKKDRPLKRSASPSSESTASTSTAKSSKTKGGKKMRRDSEGNRSCSEPDSSTSIPIKQAGTSKGSSQEGEEMFAWIIDPVTCNNFMGLTWETRPLHICREMPDYYSALFSTSKMDKMLRENVLFYTKNVDITSYKDGQRETLNPEGRATPAEVWEYYNQGCSIRLLNPQTFSSRIWPLNSMLQEYFNCFVGANIYLTPPGTQGFAPHYDDIEAFVLQLEGKKHWKLYSPRTSEEELPRVSSGNLEQEDIGQPIMDVVLAAGDLLYFPRGTIHQACALPDSHSLHITISCYQKNTWGDFLEKLLPVAVASAMEDCKELREGLPINYLHYMGVAHSDKKEMDKRRAMFIAKLHDLVNIVMKNAPFDAAADQFGKQFMHDALPPKLTLEEMECSSLENSSRLVRGQLRPVAPLELTTEVRLLRANILRLVCEEDKLRVYHCMENSKEFHADEPHFFEIGEEEGPAVEELIGNYPVFTAIGNLPLDSDAERLELAGMLWKKGLLQTSKPLELLDRK